MDQKPFVAGNRFYVGDATKAPAELQKLRDYCDNMLAAGALRVYVAVNVAEDKANTVNQPWPENVVVFPVQPWGYFVNPLNGLLTMARKDLATGSMMLFASTEIKINPAGVSTLFSLMDDKTLVVGAALEGHNYEPGTGGAGKVHTNATGVQVPWNTLALYNSRFLWITGVPMIGDGPMWDKDSKGVEELMTITIAQKCYPAATAKMVALHDMSAWNTATFTGERLVQHNKKILGKNARPAEQLKAAGFANGPTVVHF